MKLTAKRMVSLMLVMLLVCALLAVSASAADTADAAPAAEAAAAAENSTGAKAIAAAVVVGLVATAGALGMAIAIGKMTFGGLGKNPFNPALVGRVFLLIAYPAQMTSFPQPAGAVADAFSGATPLAAVKFGAVSASAIDYQDMLFGSIPGSLGEVAALALLAGFVYLLWRRVITWHVPVTILATMALFAFFVALGRGWTGSLLYEFPAFHVLAGGAILGAVFMATDYSTSPMTVRGGVIYAVGIGVITMCIRLWGAYPEGMSFAILVMNATVPLINRSVKPKRFGAKK